MVPLFDAEINDNRLPQHRYRTVRPSASIYKKEESWIRRKAGSRIHTGEHQKIFARSTRHRLSGDQGKHEIFRLRAFSCEHLEHIFSN